MSSQRESPLSQNGNIQHTAPALSPATSDKFEDVVRRAFEALHPEEAAVTKWLRINAVKNDWAANIAFADAHSIPVDALHREILALLWVTVGSDQQQDIEQLLLSQRGILRGDTVELEMLATILREVATAHRTFASNAYDQNEHHRHSEDFRSVAWEGASYSFSANQAACVKTLWQAWVNQTPDLGGATILVMAGVESDRIDLVFRNNSAWNRMIISGKTRGTYRLAGSFSA